MKNKILGSLRYVLGFAIIAVLIYKVGLSKIFDTLMNLNLINIPILIFIFIAMFTIPTFNINLLLRSVKFNLPFLTVMRYFISSWALGLFLPAKLGDFSLAFFLKKDSVGLGTGFAVVFIDRFISFFAICIFAGIGAVLLLDKNPVLIFALIIVLIALVLIFVKSDLIKRLVEKIFVNKYINLTGFHEALRHYFRKKRILTFNFAISVLNILLQTLFSYILFKNYGADIGFLTILFISSIVKLVALIPLTPGGSGLKEVSAVYLFGLVSINASITASVYITILIFNYLISAVSMLVIKKPSSK